MTAIVHFVCLRMTNEMLNARTLQSIVSSDLVKQTHDPNHIVSVFRSHHHWIKQWHRMFAQATQI